MLPNTHQKKYFSGFTLIEIMVATVLMAMMGLLLMTSLNTSVQAKDNVEHISQRYQEVRQALSRMSHEISAAYLSKNINLTEPAYLTQFKGEKNKLFFSAFGHVVTQKDAKESDQQVLGFYLATDKNGKKSLMRRNNSHLNLDVTRGGRSQILCPNVSELEFSYYDSRFKKWQDSWVSDPSSMLLLGQNSGTKQNSNEQNDSLKPWQLPAFVKISMTVEMSEGNLIKWIMQTEIPVQDPLELD
ncbi:MAG: prepilin-type N-terminal cleavage/methylation domain-containing protein [Myxococcales bacterium]|nr:prepilin-type N-terminal cleavage/methylation domain-containing protein [Myxococcales bacterium]USN49887.1 MAG: prepilin-type N-terminal cleavage/methylation domain-containing protein [Myxococcales bacterium]